MADKVSVNIKKVNVIAPIPVRTVTPNIYGKKEGLSMSPANILKCLIARATVYEVLSDGSTVKLNYNNYNKDNKPIQKSTKPKEKAQKLASKSAGSAIGNKEVRKPVVMKNSSSKEDEEYNKVHKEILKENSVSTGINVENMLDTLKDEKGNEIELPKETISKDKPAESNKVVNEEEDKELAELAAEIAKLEEEEAKQKEEQEDKE